MMSMIFGYLSNLYNWRAMFIFVGGLHGVEVLLLAMAQRQTGIGYALAQQENVC